MNCLEYDDEDKNFNVIVNINNETDFTITLYRQ